MAVEVGNRGAKAISVGFDIWSGEYKQKAYVWFGKVKTPKLLV
jgi:hypothetical protein